MLVRYRYFTQQAGSYMCSGFMHIWNVAYDSNIFGHWWYLDTLWNSKANSKHKTLSADVIFGKVWSIFTEKVTLCLLHSITSNHAVILWYYSLAEISWAEWWRIPGNQRSCLLQSLCWAQMLQWLVGLIPRPSIHASLFFLTHVNKTLGGAWEWS